MVIKEIVRPWQKLNNWENKKNPDTFYQSSQWKRDKVIHFNSPPKVSLKPIGTMEYTNRYCADCWKEGKINSERIAVDHVKRIKDGGGRSDQDNMVSLCHRHNNIKDNNKDK
jgi:hypothetical protein